MAKRSASSLSEYTRKRRFKVPDEPSPASTRAKRPTPHNLHFVVQKHAASRLHFDFRLELGGTLKLGAVPKGPSLNPSDKVYGYPLMGRRSRHLTYQNLNRSAAVAGERAQRVKTALLPPRRS